MTLFLTGFVLVFLLAFQQQNIAAEKHAWQAVTNYALAFAQLSMVQNLAQADYIGAFWFGTGAAIGASLSILAHKYLRTLKHVKLVSELIGGGP